MGILPSKTMSGKTVLLTGMSNGGKKTILDSNELNFEESTKKLPRCFDHVLAIRNTQYKHLNIISFDIETKNSHGSDVKTQYFDGLIYVIDTKDRVKLGNINIYILLSGWIRNEFVTITKMDVPNDVIDIMYEYFNIELHPIMATAENAFDKLECLDCGGHVCSSRLRYDAPILVYANKHDLSDGMSKDEIIKKLNLKSFARKWKVQTCSATTGNGLKVGMEWLVQNLDE
eukprot:49813_1